MKKFLLAALIVGAFVFYSFIYDHSSPVAAVPTSTTTKSSMSSSSPLSPASSPALTGSSSTGVLYKDGTYTGGVADAQWGNVQVKVVIQNGKITDVPFLQYPNDRSRSQRINSYADPQLTSEAIQAQSANVDIVTGATDSSEAFIQSLTDALTQAKA